MGTLRLNENGDIISKNRHEMQLGVRFHRLQMPPRVSAAPSRRGHLQSVLRDETLRHRLFRA